MLILVLISPLLWAAEDEEDEKPGRLTPEQAAEQVQRVMNADPATKGADTCLKCHDEDNEYPVMPLFKTRHANPADSRSPFALQQCETCHGPGGEHEKKVPSDEPQAPILAFGKDVWTPVEVQNQKCLQCHENHQRIQWSGSSHEFNQVSCSSCHNIHVAKDPMLQRRAQAEVCFSCHRSQRVRFMQRSHHPLRENRMACSDCHNVHADDGSGLLLSAEVREQCTSCHAEKRGPFLWEHQPAAEDCNLCHNSHGSNYPALLKQRAPQLCQQCHAQAGHPSVSYNGSVIPSVYLSVKGCLNCHANTHGSNHPSGASLVR